MISSMKNFLHFDDRKRAKESLLIFPF